MVDIKAQVKEAADKAQQFARERPLATVAALGAGVAVAALVLRYLKGRK